MLALGEVSRSVRRPADPARRLERNGVSRDLVAVGHRWRPARQVVGYMEGQAIGAYFTSIRATDRKNMDAQHARHKSGKPLFGRAWMLPYEDESRSVEEAARLYLIALDQP